MVSESEGTEYTRSTPKAKEELLPEPYGSFKLEWRKAKEINRTPCGFRGKDDPCVIVEVPLKSWIRQTSVGHIASMSNGIARLMIDAKTGIWLQCRTLEAVEGSSNYQVETTYALQQMIQAMCLAAFTTRPLGLRTRFAQLRTVYSTPPRMTWDCFIPPL